MEFNSKSRENMQNKVYFTSCSLFCTCLASLQLQVHMTKWRAIIQRINQLTPMLFGMVSAEVDELCNHW
jgi:hypothetical protein